MSGPSTPVKTSPTTRIMLRSSPNRPTTAIQFNDAVPAFMEELKKVVPVKVPFAEWSKEAKALLFDWAKATIGNLRGVQYLYAPSKAELHYPISSPSELTRLMKSRMRSLAKKTLDDKDKVMINMKQQAERLLKNKPWFNRTFKKGHSFMVMLGNAGVQCEVVEVRGAGEKLELLISSTTFGNDKDTGNPKTFWISHRAMPMSQNDRSRIVAHKREQTLRKSVALLEAQKVKISSSNDDMSVKEEETGSPVVANRNQTTEEELVSPADKRTAKMRSPPKCPPGITAGSKAFIQKTLEVCFSNQKQTSSSFLDDSDEGLESGSSLYENERSFQKAQSLQTYQEIEAELSGSDVEFADPITNVEQAAQAQDNFEKLAKIKAENDALLLTVETLKMAASNSNTMISPTPQVQSELSHESKKQKVVHEEPAAESDPTDTDSYDDDEDIDPEILELAGADVQYSGWGTTARATIRKELASKPTNSKTAGNYYSVGDLVFDFPVDGESRGIKPSKIQEVKGRGKKRKKSGGRKFAVTDDKVLNSDKAKPKAHYFELVDAAAPVPQKKQKKKPTTTIKRARRACAKAK